MASKHLIACLTLRVLPTNQYYQYCAVLVLSYIWGACASAIYAAHGAASEL